MTTKNIPALLLIVHFGVCAVGAVETSLRLDASTRPAASPFPWILRGIAAVPAADGTPLLALEPALHRADEGTDLLLRFDGEARLDGSGRWRLEPQGIFQLAPADLAYRGSGAASFRAPGS
ncbi:MAG TPA: hypothetical protein VLH39_05780, partial [Magnetospirillaceae bacterium]|nr:hypothetical protein [Magnetospirillaceae bacterium]